MKHELIKAVFKTLTIALEKNSVNKHYFLNEVGYAILADSLKLSGLMQSVYASEIIDHLFAMATETFGRELDFGSISQQFVVNAHVINVIVMLIVESLPEIQAQVFDRLLELVKRDSNAQNLSNVGVVSKIVTLFKVQLSQPSNPLYVSLFRLIKHVSTFRVSSAELRAVLRLRDSTLPNADIDDKIPLSNLKMLVDMCNNTLQSKEAPFLEINLSKGSSGLLLPVLTHIPGINALSSDRPWPPNNGFSFSCWIRLEEVAEQPANIFTLYCPGEQESLLFSITVEPGSRFLTIQTTESLPLTSYRFDWNQWYHVGITCAKSKFRHCQLVYYVNGRQIETLRHPYVANGPTNTNPSEFQSSVCARIGQPAYQQGQCNTSFQIAALYFVDDVMTTSVYQILHQLGPSYSGNLQAPLKYMQSWDYAPQKVTDITSRTRSMSSPHSSGLVTTPQGLVDLQLVNVPVIDEKNIWISLHAREFFRVGMVEALQAIGGGRMMRAFSRETGERDTKAVLRSIRNCVLSPPLNAYFTGRARAFSPSTISNSLDQVSFILFVDEALITVIYFYCALCRLVACRFSSN
jgi:hypothetical protein